VAALARWHADNGFADPTRSPLITKLLRGIRAKHDEPQKRARPLQLDTLDKACSWLQEAQATALLKGRHAEALRRARDRSVLLLGFWRAFRSDELANMRIEEIEAVRGDGLTCRPGRTKTTDVDDDRVFHCPALSRLCPVDAYLNWIELSGRTAGPVYPAISRWGKLSDRHMATESVLPLLRRILREAGADEADTYSSHSLRRGFASWASANGWELKELMEHVGWRNATSAMRYIDVSKKAMKAKFERGLARRPVSTPPGD